MGVIEAADLESGGDDSWGGACDEGGDDGGGGGSDDGEGDGREDGGDGGSDNGDEGDEDGEDCEANKECSRSQAAMEEEELGVHDAVVYFPAEKQYAVLSLLPKNYVDIARAKRNSWSVLRHKPLSVPSGSTIRAPPAKKSKGRPRTTRFTKAAGPLGPPRKTSSRKRSRR